jgi:hypothetical protein
VTREWRREVFSDPWKGKVDPERKFLVCEWIGGVRREAEVPRSIEVARKSAGLCPDLFVNSAACRRLRGTSRRPQARQTGDCASLRSLLRRRANSEMPKAQPSLQRRADAFGQGDLRDRIAKRFAPLAQESPREPGTRGGVGSWEAPAISPRSLMPPP